MKQVLVRWEKGQLLLKSENATNAEIISMLEMAKAIVIQKTVGRAKDAIPGMVSAPDLFGARKVDREN